MNTREPLNDFTFQGGFDSSLPPLDPRMNGKLADGSFNIINIDNGRNVPFGGLNSKGANTGSRILTTIGNTWGGIKDISVSAKTFTAITVTNQIPITAHGFTTGIAVTFTTSGTLPTGLALATTYYVIVISANIISVGSSYTNALAGTAVLITTGTGSGTHTATPSSATVTASGSLFQDIGGSIWGIGGGQPHLAGDSAPYAQLQLSSLLKVLLPVNGSYTNAASGSFVAGLSQPSAPTVTVLDTPGVGYVGLIDGAVSFKLARIRIATGARSIASLTSSVVVPAKKTVRLTFPLASTGQTYWNLFATQQGFGGVGIHYQLAYNGMLDIPETLVAAGTAGGVYASGALTFVTNPLNTETIVVNGVTFTFVTGASTSTNVHIGAAKEDTAGNFAMVLNASASGAINVATYTAASAVVGIVYDTLGTGGNAFTLANSSGTVAVTRSAATLTGGVAGVARSLEIDYRDGDLESTEAYIDDYPPPAGTHAARVESSMVVFGCYSDSVASPSSSSPGTCAAVSLPNYPESYKPRHILFFPEPIVTVLSRLIDSYCYVMCRNSIHAVQFVGWRDDLPSCTVTTVSPEIGVAYPQNVTQAYGRLFMWTEIAGMVAMNSDGSLDYQFGAAIRKYTKNWDNTTTVGFDPTTRSITCANGTIKFMFCLQSGNWSAPIYLSDMVSGNIEASVTTRGEQVISINNSGSHTSYSVNQGGTSLPVFYASNFSECTTKKGKNVYELVVSGEFTVAGTLFLGLHSDFRPRMFRDATCTATSATIGSATAAFTLADTSNEMFLFGAGIGNKTFTATAALDALAFASTFGMITGQAITCSGLSGCSPLANGTTYYIIVVDDRRIQLATTYANALSAAAINITTNGTGTLVINFLAGKISSPTATSFTLTNLDGTILTASVTLTGVTLIIANQVFMTTVSGNGYQDTVSQYPEMIEAQQVSVSAYLQTDCVGGQLFSSLVSGDVSQYSEIGGAADAFVTSPDVPPLNAIFCCGGECAVDIGSGSGTGSTHIETDAGTTLTFSTTTVRSGKYSIRCAPVNTSRIGLVGTDGQGLYVGRLYLRFEVFPTANEYVIYSGLSGGVHDGTSIIGIAFKTSTGTLHCTSDTIGAGNPYAYTFAGAGFAPSLNTWYRIDFKLDRINGTTDAIITQDGQSSGTTLTQSVYNCGGVITTSELRIGSWVNFAGSTGIWYYDDILISNAAVDYPIGGGYVNVFVPVSDGAHNVTAANQFERGVSGTDITNATTTAYQLVNGIPLAGNTTIATPAPNVNPTAYVETVFGAAPGSITPTVAPRMVSTLGSGNENVDNGNIYQGNISLIDNITALAIWSKNAANATTILYGVSQLNSPPSGGAWKLTTGNGNFNALKARFYTISEPDFGNPVHYFNGIMIEAEFKE